MIYDKSAFTEKPPQYFALDDFAENLLKNFPRQLKNKLKKRYLSLRNRNLKPKKLRDFISDDGREQEANNWLREIVEALPNKGLPLCASEAEIREFAKNCAKKSEEMQWKKSPIEKHDIFLRERGLQMPKGETPEAQMARLADNLWWRRNLRISNARTTETLHINLGSVQRRAAVYCSDDSLKNRSDQKARNSALLEAMVAINELGESFTLQELVDKSVSNPAIRRAELMTRIAGFEEIAKKMHLAGEFITLTAPSKYHARHAANGRENEKYQGATPRETQLYLRKTWSRITAELARGNVRIFGFRVAEPHHDGTPHWHGLFFLQKNHISKFRKIVAKHAVREDREELGLHYTKKTKNPKNLKAQGLQALQNQNNQNQSDAILPTEARFWGSPPPATWHKIRARIEFKHIDWNKGSAAGYIAKYIAKNIDGKKNNGESVGSDFEADAPIVETAERVDAWASRWGIRQFQQIGGPPVTVWRELRRLKAKNENEDTAISQAAFAADKGDWAKFVMIMGGIETQRKNMALGLLKDKNEKSNKYGEEGAPITQGVQDKQTGEFLQTRLHTWEISLVKNCGKNDEMGAREAGFARPWTCVNNSTNAKNQNNNEQIKTKTKQKKQIKTKAKNAQSFARWSFDWAIWAEKKGRGDCVAQRRKIYAKSADFDAQILQKTEFFKAFGAHAKAFAEASARDFLM